MTILEWSTQTVRAELLVSATESRPARIRRHRIGRRRRRSVRAANVLLVLVCLLTALGGVGNAVGWWRTETVLSGSMRPGIQPGDVEILRQLPASELRVGQILAFHPPHASFIVSHRVTTIHRRHATWITTKGDANNVADPWGSVRIASPDVWVVSAVVPHAGYLSVWVKTPLPHLLVIIAIVSLVWLLAIERIWRR
jgi:signal peptidase